MQNTTSKTLHQVHIMKVIQQSTCSFGHIENKMTAGKLMKIYFPDVMANSTHFHPSQRSNPSVAVKEGARRGYYNIYFAISLTFVGSVVNDLDSSAFHGWFNLIYNQCGV